MAISETAKLVAALELQDKFSGTAARANRSLSGLERATGGATKGMGIFGHAVSTALGVGLERAVSGGVRLLAGALTGGIASLNELESATVATNTVLTSTQGVSGQTAESVRKLAEKYEDLNATIDDKVIQSGENMLLTFTNIRKDAFEPALEAALNMNEAMGGGPEGLQNTVIQLGKALNDPVKGATALRRVGVTLSADQQKQIKTLVAQNDLYGAQQIILDELATEFGGRFAAAGGTAAGQMASLSDKVEDLQKSFAGPLIPVLDKVRAKLIEVLGSPAAQKAAESLGKAIASIFTDKNIATAGGVLTGVLDKIATFDFSKIGKGVQGVFGFLGEVPWSSIGAGLKITGAATKTVVDAFLSLPKEVQGIVITALAVNKLSGGIAGSLAGKIGGLAIDLFKGRGTTPANPLFVADVAGGGGIPGVGGAAGGGIRGAINGGGPIGLLSKGIALASPLLAAGAAIEVINFDKMREEQKAGLQKIQDGLPVTASTIDSTIDNLKGEINAQRPLLDGIVFNTNVRPQLEDQVRKLEGIRNKVVEHEAQNRAAAMRADANARTLALRTSQAVSADQAMLGNARAQTPILRDQVAKTAALKEVARERLTTLASRYSDIGGVTNSRLSGILAKKTAVTVNTTVQNTVSINATQVQLAVRRLQQQVGTGFTPGFT